MYNVIFNIYKKNVISLMSVSWNKYLSYYLGFLYADGSIDKYRASIELIKEDMESVQEYFEKSGLEFSQYDRNRKNRKSQRSLWICDKEFSNFLIEDLKYRDKSKLPPNIELIPKEYFRYFILGFIDGDGCYYLSKDGITKQVYITSSYEYDWSMVENLFQKLDINYKISRVVNNKEKGYKSSFIRIIRYDSIKNLYKYLYPNGYEMGLKRKYDKLINIISNKPKTTPNRDKLNLNEIKEYLKTMNYIQIAKICNCEERKIRRFAKKHKIGTYSI